MLLLFLFLFYRHAHRSSTPHTRNQRGRVFFFNKKREAQREREIDRKREEGEAGFTAKITTAKWVRKVSRASGDLANVAGDGEAESGSGAENRRRSLFSPRLNTPAHAPPTRPFGNVLRTNALKRAPIYHHHPFRRDSHRSEGRPLNCCDAIESFKGAECWNLRVWDEVTC